MCLWTLAVQDSAVLCVQTLISQCWFALMEDAERSDMRTLTLNTLKVMK